ncbi:hypothetical protein FHS85_002889 [Rhodoligotrophos appendicifer]|uniref:hypothetical protein n=1 Tax=Rhodoligotrophos appendicifer TaxID=987056 RepID=UPI0011857190|nr:hypothetical protein [Rhodoligotrophos appendicifer]
MIDPTAIVMPTESGIFVDLAHPQPSQIRLRDIARHLAKINRYCGATQVPLSVAQHSVLVAEEVERQLGPLAGLQGLMHDAHEAYLGDLTAPAIQLLHRVVGTDVWHVLTETLDAAIYQALDLPEQTEEAQLAIRLADGSAAATEWRDCMADIEPPPGRFPRPFRAVVKPVPWVNAESLFLSTYRRLCFAAGIPERS